MPTLIFTGCSSGLGLRVLHLVLSRLSALPSSPPSPSSASAKWRLIAGTRRSTPSTEQVKLSLLASNSFPDEEEEVELLWLPLDLADGTGKSVREFMRLLREEHGVEEVEGVLLNAAVWGAAEGNGVKWEAGSGAVGEEGEYVEEAVVNHFAQQHLVNLLLPLLKSAASSSSSSSTAIPPRIIYTSSNLHESISSLDDLPSLLSSPSTAPASAKTRYAASKVAALIGAQSLLEDFGASSTGIDVIAVSPGFVPTTNLSRSSGWLGQLFMRYVMSWAPFAVSEEEGAQRILRALPLPSFPSPSPPSSSSSTPSLDPLTSLLSSSRSSSHSSPRPQLLYLSGPSTSPLEEVAIPVGGAVGRALTSKQREEEGVERGGKWGEVKARWGIRGV